MVSNPQAGKSLRCWRMGCNKVKLFAPPRLYSDSMTEWSWVVVQLAEWQHFWGRKLTLIFCTMQHMEEFFQLEFERLYTLLLLDEDVAREAGTFVGDLRCDECGMEREVAFVLEVIVAGICKSFCLCSLGCIRSHTYVRGFSEYRELVLIRRDGLYEPGPLSEYYELTFTLLQGLQRSIAARSS